MAFSEFTTITIDCPLDRGIEKHVLRPEHIPSQGDLIVLDGVEFECERTRWVVKHAMAEVTVHLVPTK
jgi:hypothetical protein